MRTQAGTRASCQPEALPLGLTQCQPSRSAQSKDRGWASGGNLGKPGVRRGFQVFAQFFGKTTASRLFLKRRTPQPRRSGIRGLEVRLARV